MGSLPKLNPYLYRQRWRICTAGYSTAFGRPENTVATVIHVRNAGNMSAHWPLVSWLPGQRKPVYVFDYRGFGESEGTPSQEGLQGRYSAIDYVRHRDDVKSRAHGAQRGRRAAIMYCAVVLREAAQICATRRPGGHTCGILDSTFLSYSSIANQMIPGGGYL